MLFPLKTIVTIGFSLIFHTQSGSANKNVQREVILNRQSNTVAQACPSALRLIADGLAALGGQEAISKIKTVTYHTPKYISLLAHSFEIY